MTVDQLIKALEMYKGTGLEVRIASQPNYPIEYSIGRIITNREAGLEIEDNEKDILYITEDIQLGYSSKELWKKKIN